MTEIIGLLAHHARGALFRDFQGIFDWEQAYEISIEKIIPRLRQAVHPLLMGGLLYPFMMEPGYDPHKFANNLAVAAVAFNQGKYEIIEDTSTLSAMIYPDIICRGCGNLIQKESLRGDYSDYYCAARLKEIEFKKNEFNELRGQIGKSCESTKFSDTFEYRQKNLPQWHNGEN